MSSKPDNGTLAGGRLGLRLSPCDAAVLVPLVAIAVAVLSGGLGRSDPVITASPTPAVSPPGIVPRSPLQVRPWGFPSGSTPPPAGWEGCPDRLETSLGGGSTATPSSAFVPDGAIGLVLCRYAGPTTAAYGQPAPPGVGLRVGDLRRLELGWFDWRAKTLALTQHKTGLPLRLPLPGDVGWAVIDYIRNGRPEAGCAQVFLKHRYPFTAFGSSSSASCRLRYYARRAGIMFPARRSHGLHSLRGALAVAMLQAGTPPPVVTAVLGHAAARTTAAHYLRLDTEHLRRCALDVEDVLDSGQGARS